MAAAAEEAQELKAKGNAAFQKGNYREAIEFFSRAIKLTPEDAVLYSNRSGAWASLNQFEEALKDADVCVQLRPTWGKGYSRKGLAEFRLMKFKEAESTYEKGLRVDPSNEQMKEGLRQIGEQIDQIASVQAMIAATQAIKKNKKLARYQQEDKEYTHRLTEILKEIQKNPQSLKIVMAQPDIRIKEGIVAAMGGELPDDESPSASQQQQQSRGDASATGAAGNRREKSTSSNSSSTSSNTGHSSSSSSVSSDSTKKERNNKVINMSPEEQAAEALKEKGNALYKQKKFKEALAAYDEAIATYPKEILYLNNKAAVYMEMGEFENCLEECKKALEKRYEFKTDFSKVAKVYCRMAACNTRMGKYEDAIAAYEKALTEDNNRHTRNALNEVKKLKEKKEKEEYINPELAEQHREKGNAAFKAGDYPTAKKEYDEAIRRNPKNAVLYNNRAAALTRLFEYPSALKDADTSVELDPNYVKGWARKGNLHMLLKEYPKALQAYEKGLAVEPKNEECMQGKAQVILKVHQLQSTGEVDPEQMAHSLADPEIQSILRDPQMNIVLANIQEKPELINDYMRDPKIKDGITKLITAGILRVA